MGAASVNRYSGTCYRCGKNVAAGDGLFNFENFPGHRWPKFAGQRNMPLVQHRSCSEKYRGTNIHYIYQPDADGDDFEVIERL